MKQHFVTINHLEIELLESKGGGTPVFLFHGNSGGALGFEGVLKSELGRRQRMIAISFPGHGDSSRAGDYAGTCSIPQLGRLAARVIEQSGHREYLLVGHSLGGHAVLEALDGFPGAAGLMLVSAPPLSLATLGSAFRPDPAAGCLFKGDLSEDEVALLARCLLAEGAPATLAKVAALIRRTDPRFREGLGASLAAGQLCDEHAIFATADIPLALLAGTEDRFLDIDYVRALDGARMWRQGPQLFEGCGHALHLEAPRRFEQILADFISDTAEAT